MTVTVPPERRMANDIAAAFQYMPEERAVEAVAGHLRRFWDPRMRARLSELVDGGAEGLHPVVVAAVQQLGGPQAV